VTVPLVILVNNNSASATEIVSGAVQDHDRGLIVGETTFGKGLVQTVQPLSENTGLALTTARYYTPSGRLIQRDYKSISLTNITTSAKFPIIRRKLSSPIAAVRSPAVAASRRTLSSPSPN